MSPCAFWSDSFSLSTCSSSVNRFTVLSCESILNSDGTLSDRVSYFVKFLIHDNEPNYVWYDTWDAYKNGNSTDSQNALVTIKNRLAGQDGLIPKMINASEFQLM